MSKPISSDTAVRAASAGEHTVANAPGLILRVLVTRKGLARSWVVRATDGGRRRRFGLGRYPDVGLAKARKVAQKTRDDLADGVDPSRGAKRRQQAAKDARKLTLDKAIDGYLVIAPAFKSAKNERIRDRALRVHFAPLHSRDVASIVVSDIAGILRKLAPWTAIKSYIAIRAVFDFAAATLEPHGVTINNPADPRRLRPAGWSIRSRNDSKSHAAVDWRIAPSVVAELSRMDGPAAACMLFIAATGVRSKTARLAKWSDINLEARTWTPPFADLKEKHHKRPFVVPLNDVAIAALERVSESSRFVFGLLTDKSYSPASLTSFVAAIRIGSIRRP